MLDKRVSSFLLALFYAVVVYVIHLCAAEWSRRRVGNGSLIFLLAPTHECNADCSVSCADISGPFRKKKKNTAPFSMYTVYEKRRSFIRLLTACSFLCNRRKWCLDDKKWEERGVNHWSTPLAVCLCGNSINNDVTVNSMTRNGRRECHRRLTYWSVTLIDPFYSFLSTTGPPPPHNSSFQLMRV